MANNDMDYKPLFIDKLREFSEKYPEYSLGEIIHGVMTQISKGGIKLDSKGDLLNITDHQMYSAIDKAIKGEEKEEQL